ncbi:Small heat shock protein [Trichuris trichiura]|uniref:Small heat shock protein n=1 Tax=Trichuris trichiura TaxID=36087 RepID=A0A077ZLQ0_TRITR|nr:Small heat shock protein [Trichuris trichiura]
MLVRSKTSTMHRSHHTPLWNDELRLPPAPVFRHYFGRHKLQAGKLETTTKDDRLMLHEKHEENKDDHGEVKREITRAYCNRKGSTQKVSSRTCRRMICIILKVR